jgi:hypothetical protein
VSPALATVNIGLGIAYLAIGTLVVIDMLRTDQERGFSHFGAAFAALAFTCGPHHLAHGLHVGFEGRSPGVLDLIAVCIGLPTAAVWVYLRIESFRGGAGDRFVPSTPIWLLAIPTLLGIYATALAAAMIDHAGGGLHDPVQVIPNLLLVGLYGAIAFLLVRTQLHNRRPLGGWSISGLALAGIFVTCSAMHLVYAYYVLTGLYGPDVHGIVAGWISVPAAAYFLWVVYALYRGSFYDWNGAPGGGSDITIPRPRSRSQALPAAAVASPVDASTTALP